jgi:sulfofructose kinase
MSEFDVVGVGLNATDTMLLVPQYPPCGGKVPFTEEFLSVGGQVATAMVTCARLGLRAKYIGTIGDDERGRIQMESLRGSGVNLDHVQQRRNCPNQSAYIVVDQSSGERTVFWNRPDCLAIEPEAIADEQISCARLLHIDGHDTAAVRRAAEIARAQGIPVTVDVDTIYPGFEDVLPLVDYLIASSEFPARWTGIEDRFEALRAIQEKYGMHMAAMTLGVNGALAYTGGHFFYSPGLMVNCVDTTGAGDVFHGAFCYAVLEKMAPPAALEFSNAMAALNCTEFGARGGLTKGIVNFEEAQRLMATAVRKADPEIAQWVQEN